MNLKVYKRDGSLSSDTVELPDSLLALEPNEHAMWLAVRAEEAAQRQGTHKTKSRSYVRGGGRKPFKQKGRGVARQGSSRSPLNPGGGTIFGPMPHTYHVGVPQKVKTLARRSAFVQKAREDRVRVIEDFTLDSPKTRDMAALFAKMALTDQKVLFLMPEYNDNILLSVRNLPGAGATRADAASTRDLLKCSTLIIQKSAVQTLLKGLNHAA
ncbi:MAG: 50S ribosomal protein L4 [Calditrichaeota bacterium]|nr:50S ribosomal protein L4 [Calditrichota bacterium]MCB9366213.1 50S ribosomal protein L4 [Calditrichota bacterium]MCB9391718.1 50S ribosomal protein L4 [Calditrichota bacterium]